MRYSDRVLLTFVLGAFRSAFLTSLILVAGYWNFMISTVIIMSLIGGYMSVHQNAESSTPTQEQE